jgi:hypothetical protein
VEVEVPEGVEPGAKFEVYAGSIDDGTRSGGDDGGGGGGARLDLSLEALVLSDGGGDGGGGARFGIVARARSHCRFVPPLMHFIPDLLTYSSPLFLKRQCDRTLGHVSAQLKQATFAIAARPSHRAALSLR